MGKKRPGVKNTKQAQALSRNSRKASVEYKDVTSVSGSFDIKSLVASVASAQLLKTTKTRKVKVIKETERVNELVVREEIKLEQKEIALAESQKETQLAELSDKKDQVHKTGSAQKALEKKGRHKNSDITDVEPKKVQADKQVANGRLIEFKKLLEEASALDKLSASDLEPVVAASKKAYAAIGKLPDGMTRGVLTREFLRYYKKLSFLRSKASRLGRFLSGVKESAGKVRELPNTLKRGIALAGKRVSEGASSLGYNAVSHLPAGVAAFTVKSTARIGEGLKYVGRAIKENGINTMKWVGKRLSDLNSKVLGLFRSVKNSLGGGGPEDLMALGAIALGILPSLVEGLVDQLKKRFGDNWITGFIKEHWDSTKASVTRWLSEFIDKAISFIKAMPEKIVEGAKKAWDGTKSAFSNAAHIVKNFLPPTSDEEKSAREDVDIKAKGGTPAIRQLNNLIDDYDNAKDAGQRKIIALKIQQLYEGTPKLRTFDPVKRALQKRGFKFAVNVNNQANTSTSTATSTSVVNPTAIKEEASAAPPTPVSGGGGNATVVATPPKAGAVEGPVTAEPPPPPTSTSEGSGDASKAGGSISGGLSNATVPNQATPDTLTLLNMAGLGMA